MGVKTMKTHALRFNCHFPDKRWLVSCPIASRWKFNKGFWCGWISNVQDCYCTVKI